MNNMDNKDGNGFSYTYSAGEREEIRRIREKYIDGTEDKMARLRRLDATVTQKAQAISLVFGVIGALVLGFGMSLILSELSEVLGMSRGGSLFVGIISGMVGGALATLAYPVYSYVLKRERKRVADEVIRLTDELMK